MESQVLSFIECVNNHDIERMKALMSDDYLYIDPLGNEFYGKEKIIQALQQYFKWFPDYTIECSLLFKNEYVIGLFGCASGTPMVNGKMNHEKHWKLPAAWRVIVREGLIAEWQVYCDTKKVLEILDTIHTASNQRDSGGIDIHRMIKKNASVDAPVEEVWDAWTTPEGVITFFAPRANLELCIGGRYEMLFNLTAPPGQQGSEGVRILSFVPREMLSFEWNAPPEFPEVRREKTWVVVKFESKKGKTNISLAHLGWKKSKEWDKIFEYFDRTWDIVLARLIYRFSEGPVDWNAPYDPNKKISPRPLLTQSPNGNL